MKLLVHSFLVKLALLGRKGYLELLPWYSEKCFGKITSGTKFCTFSYLYGVYHKSSYKYCMIVQPSGI